jgi:hypothetical protein
MRLRFFPSPLGSPSRRKLAETIHRQEGGTAGRPHASHPGGTVFLQQLVNGLILGGAYVSSDYKNVFSFIILIAVLLLRPQGLFGRSES